MAGNLPTVTLIGLAVLALAILLHIIGLATPDWSHIKLDSSGTYGLWKACRPGGCFEYGQGKQSDLEAAEAFAIIGMLCSFAAGGLALIHVIFALQGKSPIAVLPTAAVGAAGATFISVLICVIIWGANILKPVYFDTGYSFVLSLIGAILVGAGGCIFFVGAKRMAGT